jgi:hypothetical protein
MCTAAWATPGRPIATSSMRRARQQAVLLGHELQWSEQLAAALVCWLATPLPAPPRDGRGPRRDGLRRHARGGHLPRRVPAWLRPANAELKPRPDDFFGRSSDAGAERMRLAREWQGRKAAAGFGAITWPQAMGGRGGTPIQELIWRQEEGRYNVPTGMSSMSAWAW